MLRYHHLMLLLLIPTLLFVGGCSGGGGGSGQATGSVAFLITDAPTDDYGHIYVTITEIALVPTAGGRPVVVFASNAGVTFDLLELSDQEMLLSVVDDIPAGSYSELHLRISDVEGIDGPCDAFTLDPEDGLVVIVLAEPLEVREGDTGSVCLDIDPGKSLIVGGNASSCTFHPIIFLRDDMDSVDEPTACLQPLEGTIVEFLTDDVTFDTIGFTLELDADRGTVDVLLMPNTSVFDNAGQPALADVLAIDDLVTVRGPLNSDSQIEARTVVVGRTTTMAGEISAVMSPTRFDLNLDEDGPYIGSIEVVTTSGTVVLVGCEELESSLVVLQTGLATTVSGKLALQPTEFRAVVMQFVPTVIDGELLFMTPVVGGQEFEVLPEGEIASQILFVPDDAIVKLQGDGPVPLDVLEALLLCGSVPVRVTLDPLSIATALSVKVASTEYQGVVTAVDPVTGQLVLDDLIVATLPGTTIIDLRSGQQMVPLDQIQMGTELIALGLEACPTEEFDFYGFVLMVLPSACCEEGKPRKLTLLYTGDDCSATNHSQSPSKVSCDGDPALAPSVHIIANDKSDPSKGEIWFEGDVDLDTTFDVDAASAGKTKLKSKTYIHVYDMDDNELQTIEFHTSCSQPLCSGDQFGSMLLVGCIGEDEPTEGSCCEDGKPIALKLRYTGGDCAATSHSQDAHKVSCDGDPGLAPTVRIIASDKDNPGAAKIWFDGEVNLDEEFEISAANAGKSKLKSRTYVQILDLQDNVLQSIEFHTSCSQPLFEGDVFGSIMLISCTGDDLPVPVDPADCCQDGKPQQLELLYTGEDCSETSHSQDSCKVSCSGDPEVAATVFVIANEKEDPTEGHLWFSGDVALNETFTVDASLAGQSKLKSKTFVHIYDMENGTLLQSIEFHTSCSQPLSVGDTFGSLQLLSCVTDSGFMVEAQGCSADVWALQADWSSTGYTQDTLLTAVFAEVALYPTLSASTLLDALGFTDTTGVEGAAGILLRSAVAGLLNASEPDILYLYPEDLIITEVNAALLSQDEMLMWDLRHMLELHNTLFCPIP